MKLNYKRISIVLAIFIVLGSLIGYGLPAYNRSIETRVAKFQSQNLQFLWYQNNQTTVITAQQLYLFFQQLEQQQRNQG